MEVYDNLYGPVPSRRMGLSLGISPIQKGYCNYSCIYCQLGRTKHMTNKRQSFFEVDHIINQFKRWLQTNKKVDVITIVGEGEPTLYKELGVLIKELKILTEIPIAVITNGALLSEEYVREDLMEADIVLPSFDASNEDEFKRINRPYGKIKYSEVFDGLIEFSKEFKGQLWIEIMFVKDYNDTEEKLLELKSNLRKVDYERIFINTPVRPPAESYVKEPSDEFVKKAAKLLGGTSINQLISDGFSSDIQDDYEAIKSIIKRHPMNQYEIKSFLKSRNCGDIEKIFRDIEKDKDISVVEYKGYKTYR